MKMKVKDLLNELENGPSDTKDFEVQIFDKSEHMREEVEEVRWDLDNKIFRIEVR